MKVSGMSSLAAMSLCAPARIRAALVAFAAGVPPAIANETIVLPYNDLAAVEAAFAAGGGDIGAAGGGPARAVMLVRAREVRISWVFMVVGWLVGVLLLGGKIR